MLKRHHAGDGWQLSAGKDQRLLASSPTTEQTETIKSKDRNKRRPGSRKSNGGTNCGADRFCFFVVSTKTTDYLKNKLHTSRVYKCNTFIKGAGGRERSDDMGDGVGLGVGGKCVAGCSLED